MLAGVEEDRGSQEQKNTVKALQGAWVNVDFPFERYVVSGQTVTRTDGQGSRQFTLQWDHWRKQLHWGTRGRLTLLWLDDGAVAWVPPMLRHSLEPRAWRWRKEASSPSAPAAASSRHPSSPSWSSEDLRNHHRRSHLQSGCAYCLESGYRHCNGDGRPSQSSQNCPFYQLRDRWDGHEFQNFLTGNASSSQRYQQDVSSFLHSDGDGFSQGSLPRQRHRSHPYGTTHAPRRERGHRGYGSSSSRHGRNGNFGRNFSRMACGLAPGEVRDLLFREITPEDYDLLLRLDENVEKPTAAQSNIDKLPTLSGADVEAQECAVCLASFEHDDVVTSLPCQHNFHRSCISKWLGECRRVCPLCGEEAFPTESL